MQWKPGDRGNVEDMRSRSGIGLGHLGVGGFVLVLLLSWATGTNLFSLLGVDSSSPDSTAATAGHNTTSPAEERDVDFVDAVANDVQAMWGDALGARYEPTRVVLFRDSLSSTCGFAQSATGPFYCPEDHKVYLDLGFFQELSDRFQAPGDFARAYVIAHEFGHHVQNLLGLTGGMSTVGANGSSVAIELQADCFAGIWGHAASAHGRFQAGHVELEPGDADEAMRAASAIGDDRLQKMATGHVMPERFTHGTSAQRVAAFQRGFESGTLRACEMTTRGS